MNDDRLANLLGAMAFAVVDTIDETSELVRNHNVALNVIAHSPGCSVKHLAEILGLSHPATVRLVDSLARDELLERTPGPDGRTLALYLTRPGRAAWRTLRNRRIRRLSEVVQSLDLGTKEALARSATAVLEDLTSDAQQGERICRACDESACPQSSCPVTVAATAG